MKTYLESPELEMVERHSLSLFISGHSLESFMIFIALKGKMEREKQKRSKNTATIREMRSSHMDIV